MSVVLDEFALMKNFVRLPNEVEIFENPFLNELPLD